MHYTIDSSIKFEDINQMNGQVAFPARVLMKDLSLTALGMYVIVSSLQDFDPWNDEQMMTLFYPRYDYSDYWKEDRRQLHEHGLIHKPNEYVEETAEEVAARLAKFKEDLEAFDLELEQELEEEFKA